MIGTIIKDQQAGNIKNNVSTYKPSREALDVIRLVKQDYGLASDVSKKTYHEFDGVTLEERMQIDQKNFNSYRAPRDDGDPQKAWMAQAVRPITRARIISIAAHMAASMIMPVVFAQNEDQQEDKDAATVMSEIMEYLNYKAGYVEKFIFVILGACVNPAIFVKVEYVEAYQKIKKLQEDSSIKTEDVIDTVLSGLQMDIVAANELLIPNIYEYDLQRQRFIIHRRYIDYSEAEGLYGNHDDFKYVQAGVNVFYEEDTDTFYKNYDKEKSDTLVEEVTYYNRREDLQLTFINGILVTKHNQRIKHRTAKDMPKYCFAKCLYEPIDERKFVYGKSVAHKLGPDQETINKMWNYVLDGSFLQVMPPVAVIGPGNKKQAPVIVPGASSFYTSDTSVQTINSQGNLTAGYNAVQSLEQSMSESSQDVAQSGVSSGGGRTAREIMATEKNAQINMRLFASMVSSFVKDYGELIVDIALTQLTVGQVGEIAGVPDITYSTFLVPANEASGRSKTSRIEFTDSFSDTPLTDEEIMEKSMQLMNRAGDIDSSTIIYQVDPIKFSRHEYLIYIDADKIAPRSKEVEKALKLEAYDRMIANPYAEQEKVSKDFLFDVLSDGKGSKYMTQAGLQAPQQSPPSSGGNSNIAQQLTGSNSLSKQLAPTI